MTSPITIVAANDNHVFADTDERLSDALEKLVARRCIHHATVAIEGEDGKQWWTAAAGPSDFAPRPDTPFFIASITKRFIITLVLQAHERGELNLSAPINRYLPAEVTVGLDVFNGIDQKSMITVRQLPSHTSGLPDNFEKRREGVSLNEHVASGQDLPGLSTT